MGFRLRTLVVLRLFQRAWSVDLALGKVAPRDGFEPPGKRLKVDLTTVG